MSSLKGILYASGNIDFPRDRNEWAFSRLESLRSDQEKRIVLNPQIAPLELDRAAGVDEDSTGWLTHVQDILNSSSSVNLLRRENTLRLRKAVHHIDDDQSIVTLVSQEALNEFCAEHWSRINYFYASRHDGFRFDLLTLISMKDGEADREHQIELVTRLVDAPERQRPCVTFDATGSSAHVSIVEWRGSVAEGDSGRFQPEDARIRISMSPARMPLIFLYERRREFHNHGYHFSGEKLERQLKRALRRRPPAAG